MLTKYQLLKENNDEDSILPVPSLSIFVYIRKVTPWLQNLSDEIKMQLMIMAISINNGMLLQWFMDFNTDNPSKTTEWAKPNF